MKPEIIEPDISDALSIYSIIKIYSDEEIILERSIDDITGSIDKFLIAKRDKQTIGVISFYDYGPNLKEIRSLSVIKSELRNGIGSLLLEALIKKISGLENSKIFTLTYIPDFFKKNGFLEVPKDSLPEKIWKDCSKCKNKDNCKETALMYDGKFFD